MENSSNNSMNTLASKQCYSSEKNTDDHPEPEESGWTMYLEDFRVDNKNEQSSFSYETSLISDAGSSAKIKRGCYKKMSSFKKRKSILKIVLVDDDHDDALEDTASSPVQSPKVFNMSEMGMKPKEKEDYHHNMFEDKGVTNSDKKDNQIFMSHEKTETGRGNDCTALKKRGLCLVPLSLLANYIG